MTESDKLEAPTSPGIRRSWWSELSFCIAGLAMFAVIVVILYLHDQQQQPQWALGITLNAVLALLSTMCKASFMIALAEVISQWKWNLYSNADNRPIQDFNLVDLASRGFWGSCLLLDRFKWRHPVSIAGLISILSVAISPITQQAIEYPTRSAGTYGRSSIGISRHWANSISGAGVTPVSSALISGIYSSVSHPPSLLDADCPTSRCSFSSYESLAFCTKIADITDMLTVTTTAPENWDSTEINKLPQNFGDDGLPTTRFYNSLPNNVTYDTNFPFGFAAMPGNTSLAFEDDVSFPSAMLHMYIIAATTDDLHDLGANVTAASVPTPKFEAFEILFYMCVNKYHTSVDEGKTKTIVESSTSVPVTNEASNITEAPKMQCRYSPWYMNRIIKCYYDTEGGNMTLAGGVGELDSETYPKGGNRNASSDFSFVPSKLEWVANELATSARCNFARFRRADGIMEHLTVSKAALWLRDALYGPDKNITDPKEQIQRLNDYYNGIATSISNVIRTAEPSDKFLGTVWEPEVFVNVRWGWLGFLAMQLVLATAFIVFTTFATRKAAVPVLKSSSMATLLALDAEVRQNLGWVDELSDAEQRAKQTRVRFDNKNLVLVRDTDEDMDEAARLSVPSSEDDVRTDITGEYNRETRSEG